MRYFIHVENVIVLLWHCRDYKKNMDSHITKITYGWIEIYKILFQYKYLERNIVFICAVYFFKTAGTQWVVQFY